MTNKETNLTYSQAVARLEEIMHKMENGDMDVDQLVDTLSEAQTLIAFCKKRLSEVDGALRDVMDKQQGAPSLSREN